MPPTFFDHPQHFTVAEFRAYLSGLAFENWKPKFPTLHNTGVPSLAQWRAMGATPQERWGASLNRYYQGMGWHAGPHLVVCPDYVWVLCDLTQPGVSVSCWNSETFGVEMVGNYEIGGDDFASGEGARVRDNAIEVLAILAQRFGWGDLGDYAPGERGLHLHRECARDHHACPGSKVSRADVLSRVAAIANAPATPQDTGGPKTVATGAHFLGVEDIQAALNQLGAKPPLSIDGRQGPATIAALRAFQAAHGCTVDGWAGPQTCAALEAALTPST